MTVSLSIETPALPALPLRRQRHLAGRVMLLLAAGISLCALLPLGFIVWIAVESGWQTALALIWRPRVGELLVNTLLLELCTLPPAVLLAVALAWLTERSDMPGARFFAWLAVAPLAVPAFVQSYAWVSLFPRFHGLPAAVLVSVLAYLPFLYLPVAAQMRRLDPELEHVAASLGHSPGRVILRVVLPQLRLAICGGSLLVGLHLFAEYGLYAMIRFDTFTTAIIDQFQSSYNGPAANMLAGVLVLSCCGLIGLEWLLRGNARYARLGSGAPRPIPRPRLGAWRLPALGLPLAFAGLSLGVPALTLTRWLAASGADAWWQGALGASLVTTLGYAAFGALATAAAALPVAWLSVRAPGRMTRFLESCHGYLGALPGVVVALALVTVTVRIALPLYQTVATVIFAYVLMFLPRALVGLRSGIAQVPVELERAAMSLGRSPAAALLAVTLPLAAPGVAAAMALVAMGVATELTATLLLAPNGTRTLATEFWSLTSELDYAKAAPYAVLMILLSLPMTALLHAQARRSLGA
ncbi:MAG: iron ABC transporter permease [Bosea sp.]|nr:iron ABC transporter permease [Bosea sp. (in: a-proteobacteria)]MCP4732714.1 iron ABC transporter permease [Bosea sp. (in: a-proteobacteria)]